MDVDPIGRRRLQTDLLKGVSRSFYLTLRMLPKGLREPVGLAYLLARAADTIADSVGLPPPERLNHLRAFRGQVQGPPSIRAVREIGLALVDLQSIPEERVLLAALPEAFSALAALPESDRSYVRSVVLTLIHGMEMDLTTFPSEDSGRIKALKDHAELDRYAYYVAGCVGEFWTAITMSHVPLLRRWDQERMSRLGVGFGKALQLTNILRDVPRDLRIGRCYLPESQLADVGAAPEELMDPSAGPKARPVLHAGIRTALEYYLAAEKYLLAIPRRCIRLRLAALWPVLIGLGALGRLARNGAWLDPVQPSKVTRRWVYGMLALSVPAVFSDGLLRFWIGRLRKHVEAPLV